MNDLANTQRRLWQLLTAPSGVRVALAEEGDPDGRALEGFLGSDARLPAAMRLEVYANAYFQRIHDVLARDFGALAEALGAEGFHDLVTAYLCVHPPERPSLRHAGEKLADFLASHAAAQPFRRRWPFAADLARLEWALAAAFDAADAASLERSQLVALPPEAWQDLVLALHPCVQRLDVRWNVAALREAFEAGSGEPDAPTPCASTAGQLLVWRRAERVWFRTLAAEEAELLDRLAAGVPFGALCEQLAARHGSEDAPARAAAWLAGWIDAELLACDGPGPA
jgi:hypothetical protein